MKTMSFPVHPRITAKLINQIVVSFIFLYAIAPALHARNNAALQLTLEPSKHELVIGEPLYVTLRLRNNGHVSVKVMDNFRINNEALAVFAIGESHQRLHYRPMTLALQQTKPIQLAPGEEITALAAIFFGSSGWYIVNREGTYQLQARYRMPLHTGRLDVASEPITVTVSPGDGAGRFLIDGDRNGEAAKFLFWQGGDHLQRGITHLAKLMADYPQSPLADYIRVAMAASYSRPFKNYSIDKLRPINCPYTLEALRGLNQESLPIVLRVRSSLDQARCLITLGRHTEARQVLIPALRYIDANTAFRPLLKEAVQLEPMLSDKTR